MSEGMVTTNLKRRPDFVKGPTGVGVDLSTFLQRPVKFSTLDYEFPNPITSFRSGPQFDRLSGQKGAVTSTSSNPGEIFARATGDIGHEFSMRKVVKFLGYTKSRRVDVSLPPQLDALTNPIPTFVPGNNSSNLYSKFYDKDWKFVSNDSQLSTLGTSFIKSTNPIQSQVDLLSDISEAIVDGALLPEIVGKNIVSALINPKNRRALIHASGAEFLNYIFGFKPLADDAAKVGVLIDHVNDIVNQWIKDNGTVVRRRRRALEREGIYSAEDFSYSPTNGLGQNYTFFLPDSGSPGYINSSIGYGYKAASPNVSIHGHLYCTLSQEITFSAGYMYDFSRLLIPSPEGSSAADLMHDAALRGRLDLIAFGLDTASLPKSAYDAIPFSWLLDWFANIGDILDNFRGLQSRGVQLLWGYLTETSEYYADYLAYHTFTPTGQTFFTSAGTCAQKAIRRIRATPFGFGVQFGSLSQSQIEILGALLASKT